MDVSGPNGGDFLEVQGRTFDLAGAEAWTAGTVAGTNLAGQMPAGSLGVVAGTGIAESAAQQWKSLAAISMLGFADMAEGFGLKLPADFTALLGEETAAALGSFEGAPGAQPEITLRTRGGDLKRAKVLATLVTDALGLPAPAAQKLADGFVVGNSKTAVQAAAEHTETLADTDSFTRAVPDADGAAMVVYANLAKIRPAVESAEAKKMEALEAVGFTVTAAESPSFRLRITTR